ncbi:hypothetical protein ACEPAH_1687 [Sanghuangporus vaninii]
MSTSGDRHRHRSGNSSTPGSGSRRDSNRIVPQPTSAGNRTQDKSRGSHQPHQHSTKAEAGRVKDQTDQNDEALIADRVEATKKLINWAIEDLANTIGAFKEMQKILENQEKKRDMDVASIHVFGPINLTKKHWGFDTKISEYKATARAEIAFWKNAEKEAEAAKAEWEKNLEFLNETVFTETIKTKPSDKNKTSWKSVWEAGSRNAPWQKYEQINNRITSYYEKTWKVEPSEISEFFSSPGRQLKQKLDGYVERSKAH